MKTHSIKQLIIIFLAAAFMPMPALAGGSDDREIQIYKAMQAGKVTPAMLYELGDIEEQKGEYQLADVHHQEAINQGYDPGPNVHVKRKPRKISPKITPREQEPMDMSALKAGALRVMNDAIANDRDVHAIFQRLTEQHHASPIGGLSVSKVEAIDVAVELFDGAKNPGIRGENISKYVFTVRTTWEGRFGSPKMTDFLVACPFAQGTQDPLPPQYKFHWSNGTTKEEKKTNWETIAAYLGAAAAIFEGYKCFKSIIENSQSCIDHDCKMPSPKIEYEFDGIFFDKSVEALSCV